MSISEANLDTLIFVTLTTQKGLFFYFSANAARSFSGNLPLISRSIERIIDEMARADEPPWPIITGALIPITGVPPIDS